MSVYLKTLFTAATAAALVSCGGGSSSPTGSTQVISPSTGVTGPSGATVTITAAGVSPSQVSITVGQSVTFVNNDTRPHEMNSDPHPEHTDCPELNQVGRLESGQQRDSGNLNGNPNTAKRCGFHDHINDNNAALKGSITIP